MLRSSGRVNQPSPPATALRVQSSILGQPIPIGWGQARLSGNLLWYGDFLATAVQSQGGGGGGKGLVGGGGGGKGSSGSSTYTYSAAVYVGICEGPISGVLGAWNNKSAQTLAELNLTAITGTYSQSAWGYLTTFHPTEALTYRGKGAVAAGPMQLGSSQELPNLSYETLFAINSAISGQPDASPKDVLVDFLTNVYYGIGFPSARIGSLTLWSDYCLACGLVVSPTLQAQTAGSSFVSDLMKATNSELVWAGGLLTVVPYGDQNVTGNGHTYTAPSVAIYSLSDSDMLPNANSTSGATDPVSIHRVSQADAKNITRVGFLDRDNDYNPDIAEAKDEASIVAYGERPADVVQLEMFKIRSSALLSAQLLLGRQTVRNLPSITVGPEYILLDPMDIIEYIDTALGANNQWIRIKEITENDDSSLTFALEEYPNGGGSAPLYSSQSNLGYSANYNSDPGDANTPFIFDVPVQLSDVLGLETWLATSGGTNWGGCEVHISSDNVTYALAGRMEGPSRMGVLTAILASGSDPDTTHTLAIDVSQSRASFVSGSHADADAARTLCFVDGEYLSFSNVTLTSANHYSMGSYLRRGQAGSHISAHAIGSSFVRLDDGVFVRPYTQTDVNSTIYVKLRSFNIWGGGLQDLSTCTVYTHVIGGPPVEYAPSSLTAVSVPQGVMLKWVNPPNVGVQAVEVWRSTSSSFGGAVHIADAAAYTTSYIDQDADPLTPYWYWIRTRDMAGGTGAYDPSSGGPGATETTGANSSLFPTNGDPSWISNGQFVDINGNPTSEGWGTNVTLYDFGASFSSAGWPNRYGGDVSNSPQEYYGLFFPAAPGDTYYSEAYVLNGTASVVFGGVQWYDANFGGISFTSAWSQGSSGSVALESGQCTAPAGAVYGRYSIVTLAYSSSNWWITKVLLRKAANSNLLVNGSVATQHVQNNAVTKNPGLVGPNTGLPNTGTPTQVASQTMTQVFGFSPVTITVQCSYFVSSVDFNTQVQFVLRRDGSNLNTVSVMLGDWLQNVTVSSSGEVLEVIAVDGNLPAGSHTYDVIAAATDIIGNTGYPHYTPIYGSVSISCICQLTITYNGR